MQLSIELGIFFVVIRLPHNFESIILLNGHHHQNGNGYVISHKIPVSYLFLFRPLKSAHDRMQQSEKEMEGHRERERKEVKFHSFHPLVIVCDVLHNVMIFCSSRKVHCQRHI